MAEPPGSIPGSTSGSSTVGSPSTSSRPTNRSPAVDRVCCRLVATIASPSRAKVTGAFTAANSASPGVGVPSGSTIPSITKLPSCTTSPKSPP